MNPALWGTLTAFGWGTADFAARFSGRALGHANALLGMLLVGSVVLTAWVGLTGPRLVWDPAAAWLLLVTGVGVMAATLLLYQGLARGPVTIVAPIVGSYPALVVAIAVLLGARPSGVQWTAMAAVMAGVVIVARAAGGFEARGAFERVHLRKTVGIALVSSCAFALAISAGQAATPVFGELQTLWVTRLVSLAALVPIFLLPGQQVRLTLAWWPVLAAQGLLDSGAYLALFSGSLGAGAEMAAVTASAFGAVTVLLARIFLREAMSRPQWGGIVL
ncbi:MAG: DMT family transporter, partial [Alphaproteobacteria bacterium]